MLSFGGGKDIKIDVARFEKATRDAAGTIRVALIAPRRVRVSVAVPRRRCTAVWLATARPARTRTCGGRSLSLPARSLAVVTFAARRDVAAR